MSFSSVVTAGSAVANPLASKAFYISPNGAAAKALKQYPQDAKYLRILATTPQAVWFGDWNSTGTVSRSVRTYVSAARAAHKQPVVALYAIPNRDCQGHSAGGVDTPAEYKAWIRQVAKGLAGYSAVVILEPDALASTSCLTATARNTRIAELRDAVRVLTANTLVTLYIDAGNSRWQTPKVIAASLKQVDISRARGFSLNVANFQTTSQEIAYGKQISNLTGNSHFVIDTSRNGRGPAVSGKQDWCNPPGRSVGIAPTVKTASPSADAYLWIKTPGLSDGGCGRSDPPAGNWFNAYAVGLVKDRP